MHFTPAVWVLLAVSIALLVLGTLDGWQKMIRVWDASEAYGKLGWVHHAWPSLLSVGVQWVVKKRAGKI
jgi:hypothetical protein